MRQLVSWGREAIRSCSIFNRKSRAFRRIFEPHGDLYEDQKIVLKALYDFCYVGATDHGTDEIRMARAVGRREVWNWIVGHVGYDPFDLDMLMRQMEEVEDE